MPFLTLTPFGSVGFRHIQRAAYSHLVMQRVYGSFQYAGRFVALFAYVYLPSDFPNIASLAEEADHRRLFKSIIQCQTHVLRHLFKSPPLRAPSVLGRIISSCPLKTVETLSLGFFTRPFAPPPSGLRVAVCPLILPKGCFNDLLQLLILFTEFFLLSWKPFCVCVKGGLNKRRRDLRPAT